MKILLDTNVLIDYLATREPFADEAERVLTLCRDKKAEGCIAAHSVMNIFYILRKSFTLQERRDILLNLCELFTVVGIDKGKITAALRNESFSDFEDCLQEICADGFGADFIVTRNTKDFENSKIPAVTPSELLAMV